MRFLRFYSFKCLVDLWSGSYWSNFPFLFLLRFRNIAFLLSTLNNVVMKKICFLLFLFCTCIAQAQNAYRTDKIYLMSLVPKRIPIVWNVVNWIFITLKTRRISQLLSGFTVVVWKAEINLSQKNCENKGLQ